MGVPFFRLPRIICQRLDSLVSTSQDGSRTGKVEKGASYQGEWDGCLAEMMSADAACCSAFTPDREPPRRDPERTESVATEPDMG